MWFSAGYYGCMRDSNKIKNIAECKLSDLSERSTDSALCFELVLLRILFVFISCQAACATELLKWFTGVHLCHYGASFHIGNVSDWEKKNKNK